MASPDADNLDDVELLAIATKATGAKSSNPEFDLANSYFDRTRPKHRFDNFGLRDEHRLLTDPGAYHFDPDFHPESTLTRACVSVELAAFLAVAQPQNKYAPKMRYLPCSISSGSLAHEAIDEKNNANKDNKQYDPSLTTYHAAETIGGKDHQELMAKNRDNTLIRAQYVSLEHPDEYIIVPPVRENTVNSFNDHDFAGGQRYDEEEFMAFWFVVIDLCGGTTLDGDWNISRNSIWEMMRGILIQSGEIPGRDQADMDVEYLGGKPVPLYDRTKIIADTLKYQLGKGFLPREAATALAQIFTIDDEILSGKIPSGKLHPVLRRENRTARELFDMKKLKEEIKPILLKHCAQYMRLDDLPSEYHEAAEAAEARLEGLTDKQRKAAMRQLSFEVQVDELHKALNNEKVDDAARQLILKAIPKPESGRLPNDVLTDKAALTEFISRRYGTSEYYGDRKDAVQQFLDAFQPALKDDHPLKEYKSFHRFAEGISERVRSLVSVKPSRRLMVEYAKNDRLPQRRFDTNERFFEKNSRAQMFEDDLYGKLLEWERIALPFAIGATEIGLSPEKKPMTTMVLTDLKRGIEGFKRAQERDSKVHNMNELAGALGRDIKKVISKNVLDAEALKEKFQAEDPGRIVVNTLSFLHIADAIERARPKGFVQARGGTKTSPEVRLALQMKYLDRSVGRAVFQKGWEYSNDLVQLRVRARLVQAGLVERPAPQSALHVFTAADTETLETLLRNITSLTAEVKRVAAPKMLLDNIKRLSEEVSRAAVDPEEVETLLRNVKRVTKGLKPAGGLGKVEMLLHDISVSAEEIKSAATPKTLLDDIELLTRELKRTESVDARAQEQVLGLLRLVALHDLRVDPKLRKSGGKTTREIFSAHAVNAVMASGDFGKGKEIVDEAKALLDGKVAAWIPRERLEAGIVADDDNDRKAAKRVQNSRMEDFIGAQDEERGKQKLEKLREIRRRAAGEIRIGSRGAGRGS